MHETKPRRGCLWPMWPHGDKPNHQYCGDKRSPGSSYCEHHKAMSIRNLETEPRQPFVPRRKAA